MTAALTCQPDWQRARPFRARRAADERRGQWTDGGCRLRDLAEVGAGGLAPAEGNGNRIGGRRERMGGANRWLSASSSDSSATRRHGHGGLGRWGLGVPEWEFVIFLCRIRSIAARFSCRFLRVVLCPSNMAFNLSSVHKKLEKTIVFLLIREMGIRWKRKTGGLPASCEVAWNMDGVHEKKTSSQKEEMI